MPARNEIEIKLRLARPEELRERLTRAGARRVGLQLESNRILDAGTAPLRASGCALRVRVATEIGGGPAAGARGLTTLSFKGPASGAGIRSREEIETTVGDADALLALLSRLGYREVVIYDKRRETWHWGACTVTLDELPRLGWWVEIEGPTVTEVASAREALGLAGIEPSEETFVAMAARAGRRDGAGCVRLEFPVPAAGAEGPG